MPQSIVLVSERTDEIIRDALPSDLVGARVHARIPRAGGYAYLARSYTDSAGNELTEGLTDTEIADLVLIETMPAHLRASHRAARNFGVYPHNGAVRGWVSRDEASSIVDSDPDGYDRVIA
jgi:hypothetical protein